jgi:hypothetical protein
MTALTRGRAIFLISSLHTGILLVTAVPVIHYSWLGQPRSHMTLVAEELFYVQYDKLGFILYIFFA